MKPHSSHCTPTPADTLGTRDAALWRLSVSCPEADRVMLVRDEVDGLSKWEAMDRNDDSGAWELALPGDAMGRGLRYYTVREGSVVNCGTAGLSAKRID